MTDSEDSLDAVRRHRRRRVVSESPHVVDTTPDGRRRETWTTTYEDGSTSTSVMENIPDGFCMVCSKTGLSPREEHCCDECAEKHGVIRVPETPPLTYVTADTDPGVQVIDNMGHVWERSADGWHCLSRVEDPTHDWVDVGWTWKELIEAYGPLAMPFT